MVCLAGSRRTVKLPKRLGSRFRGIGGRNSDLFGRSCPLMDAWRPLLCFNRS
uniref:Uncharacterized protein n=1 Tax=Tetranychus urticae TaxID=32264 RepID=T1JUI4_TETUR